MKTILKKNAFVKKTEQAEKVDSNWRNVFV